MACDEGIHELTGVAVIDLSVAASVSSSSKLSLDANDTFLNLGSSSIDLFKISKLQPSP